MAITAEQCVALLRDFLATRPQDQYSQEFIDWHADVIGTIREFSAPTAIPFDMHMRDITNINIGLESPMALNRRGRAIIQFAAATRALYTQLRLRTNAFQTAQVARGDVYDYFAEIRQIIAGSAQEVFFIDRYLDAEFVGRYLPQIPAGVSVRLLTSNRQAAALHAACTLYTQQHGTAIEVRKVPNEAVHDRHLIIDGRDLYHSGASFKDGGRLAPTSINQIVDVAAELIRALETTWANATPAP